MSLEGWGGNPHLRCGGGRMGPEPPLEPAQRLALAFGSPTPLLGHEAGRPWVWEWLLFPQLHMTSVWEESHDVCPQ